VKKRQDRNVNLFGKHSYGKFYAFVISVYAAFLVITLWFTVNILKNGDLFEPWN